jgi:hypothetical protein
MNSVRSKLSCSKCGTIVTEHLTFCPNCGSIFSELTFCLNHGSRKAQGVCVICAKPYCKKCGKRTNGVFLCDLHWQYETHEGMARVFGTTDNLQAQYVASLLEQAGYHPFLYSKIFNPNADLVAITKVVRNYGNHPVVEMKVLVPFTEVLNAEKTLEELQIRDE